MEGKQDYPSEESHHELESPAKQPRMANSRRQERAMKARIDGDERDQASQTDSGSGDHFSPTNVTSVPRMAGGARVQDEKAGGSAGKRRRPSRRPASRHSSAKRQKTDRPAKRGPGGIFKTAAVRILTEASCLLSSGVIYDRAMRQGLVNESAGKTPEATMAAALYTDIKKYHNQSTFIKPREGLFGLRDWLAEGCEILSPEEKADMTTLQEPDRDSGLDVSGMSGLLSSSGREQTPSHRPPRQLTSKERREERRSRPVARYMRQPRSHSVPPAERIDVSEAAQPAISGPPAIFANDRLQALFAAVDQVSGSPATSDLASIAESMTESEGEPTESAAGQSSGASPLTASVRASVEPEADSAHASSPTQVRKGQPHQAKSNNAEPIGEPIEPSIEWKDLGPEAEAQSDGGNRREPSGVGESPQRMAFMPFMGTSHPDGPLNLAAAHQQIEVLEKQLQSLDQEDASDPRVGGCHMQLSTLYLAVGEKEKALKSYKIAFERCEAMLA